MRNAFVRVVGAVLVLAPGAALAQYPPPTSPQDAACRNYASNRVFSTPRPPGVALETIGRRYWEECMRRSGALRSQKAGKSRRATYRRPRR